MAVYLYAEYNTADFTFDLTVNEAGTPFNVVDSTTRLCHNDISSVLSDVEETAAWLQAELRAGSPGGVFYDVSWSEASGAFQIGGDGTAFSLTFNNATTRLVLGFAGNVGMTIEATSDITPYFFIKAAMDGRSAVSDDYEASSVATDAETDDGNGYSVEVGTPATFSDFTLQHESQAATLKRKAPDGTTAGDVPWTYQHLFEHCRVKYAFAVKDTLVSETTVHRFMGETARWNNTTRWPSTGDDYHDLWTINFRTRLVGRL